MSGVDGVYKPFPRQRTKEEEDGIKEAFRVAFNAQVSEHLQYTTNRTGVSWRSSKLLKNEKNGVRLFKLTDKNNDRNVLVVKLVLQKDTSKRASSDTIGLLNEAKTLRYIDKYIQDNPDKNVPKLYFQKFVSTYDTEFKHPYGLGVLNSITTVYAGLDGVGFFQTNGYMNASQFRICFHHIYEGLLWLHRRHIVHRDIKVENIAYDGKTWRIIDFGFAFDYKNVNPNDNTIPIDNLPRTPTYAPPILSSKTLFDESKEYLRKIKSNAGYEYPNVTFGDIYAFANTLLQMIGINISRSVDRKTLDYGYLTDVALAQAVYLAIDPKTGEFDDLWFFNVGLGGDAYNRFVYVFLNGAQAVRVPRPPYIYKEENYTIEDAHLILMLLRFMLINCGIDLEKLEKLPRGEYIKPDPILEGIDSRGNSAPKNKLFRGSKEITVDEFDFEAINRMSKQYRAPLTIPK